MVVSYTNWHSLPWAIFHGILGWIYVIYYAIVHSSHQRAMRYFTSLSGAIPKGPINRDSILCPFQD